MLIIAVDRRLDILVLIEISASKLILQCEALEEVERMPSRCEVCDLEDSPTIAAAGEHVVSVEHDFVYLNSGDCIDRANPNTSCPSGQNCV
jgi:hypothetical protein